MPHEPPRIDTSPRLTVEIVETRTGFDRLRPEWDRLHALAHREHLAFQSHAWLSLWCDAYIGSHHPARRLAIVVLRRGPSACLICPFAVDHELGLTRLVWMGEPASQYGDVLLDPKSASSAEINFALDTIIRHTTPDVVELRRVRADAAIAPTLECRDVAVSAGSVAAYMNFASAPTYDAYAGKFSAKARKNRRRLRRRIEEKGPITVEVLEPGREAADAVRQALAFKHDWLLRRGEVCSALREPGLMNVLINSALCRDRRFRPFVSALKCGDETISVQFGLLSENRLAMHLIAYNPDWEKAGAGILHIEETAAYCISAGITELDFLAPDAAYKREWSDGAVPVADYLFIRTWSGRVFTKALLRRSRDRVKTLLARLPHAMRCRIARQLNRSIPHDFEHKA